MFLSKGLKRFLASQILLLIQIIQASGSAALLAIVPLLQALAAALGVVGVAHAAVNIGSLKKYLLSTIGALIAIAQYIPALAPYRELLEQIGALIAAALVGEKISEAKSKA